jgi:hypothetical protein
VIGWKCKYSNDWYSQCLPGYENLDEHPECYANLPKQTAEKDSDSDSSESGSGKKSKGSDSSESGSEKKSEKKSLTESVSTAQTGNKSAKKEQVREEDISDNVIDLKRLAGL